MGYYNAASDVTRFEVYAIYSTPVTGSSSTAMGNLIDNANWIPIAAPNPQTIDQTDPLPEGSDLTMDVANNFTPGPADEIKTVDADKQDDYNNQVPGIYDVKVPVYDANDALVGHVDTTVTILTAEPEAYPVSGTITGLPDNSNVTLAYTYTDPNTGEKKIGSVKTDAEGNYTIPGVPAGTKDLRITPQDQNGYQVDKHSISVPEVTGAVTDQDFAYAAVQPGKRITEPTTEPTAKPTAPPQPQTQPKTRPQPQTGDSSRMPLLAGLALAGGLTALLTFKRRKTEK